MDKMIIGLFAVLSFYVGFVYLFQRDLAAHWDSSRRQALGQDALERNAAWDAKARRRGIAAVVVGLFFVGVLTGVL